MRKLGNASVGLSVAVLVQAGCAFRAVSDDAAEDASRPSGANQMQGEAGAAGMETSHVVAPGCGAEAGGPRVVRLVPEEYDSIQAAIDASGFGDTVRVSAGSYHETLTLTSGVHLLGAGAGETILDGGGRAENLIDASYTFGAVVQGFTLRGVTVPSGCANPSDPLLCSGGWYAAAIYVDGHLEEGGCPTSLEISDNFIEDNDIGVMLYYQLEGSASIHDNRFVGNRAAVVANHHGDGRGALTHNLFVDSYQAVLLDRSLLSVTHNVFANDAIVLVQQYGGSAPSCNLVYDCASVGNRLELGSDGNVEAATDPFLLDGFGLAGDAPETGCVDDTGDPIVPGPRSGADG